MRYCEKCSALFAGGSCPRCRAAGRPPQNGDICFLTEQGRPWCDMLADVLKQRGIPFLQKGRLGAGMAMNVGPLLERFRLYVAYENYQEAAAVVEELFGEEGE